MSDLRFIALKDWLATRLCTDFQIKLISGDASFRRYFRVQLPTSCYIAMDSPPELIPVQPFIDLAKAYQEQGILVPQVIEQNIEQGFLLLSDLGDVQLLSCLNENTMVDYYARAIDLLGSVFAVTVSAQQPLPTYDAQFVMKELAIFSEWLLGKHLNMSLSASETRMLDDAFKSLTDNAMAQPQGGMHRDYHSRNIMIKDDALAVIDFQDAVIGPVTYDAVSLLRDCYIRCSDATLALMMRRHYDLLIQRELITADVSFAQYRRWFDLMGIQRHLKAAGIFCRLNYRDSKPAYMADIPMTLQYIVDVAATYPELHALRDWLIEKVQNQFEAVA